MASPQQCTSSFAGILLLGLVSAAGLLWGCSHTGSGCQTSRESLAPGLHDANEVPLIGETIRWASAV